MRRRVGMKRRLDKLEQSHDMLLRLMTLLREGGNDCVVQLANLIRSNPPLTEIRAFLDQQVSPSEVKEIPELQEAQRYVPQLPASRAKPDRLVLHVNRLSDTPPGIQGS